MANNLIRLNEGTHTEWADSGADLAMTLKGLASGAGRQGATKDFGVTVRPHRFLWVAFVQFDTATAPVVGEAVDIYLKTSDGTNFDNDDGEGDIVVSAEDKLKNLHFLGSIVVDEAAADVHMQKSGFITIVATEVAPVFWNATADNLDDDAAPTNSGFKLIEVPLEVQ